jgi:hypothetical protein
MEHWRACRQVVADYHNFDEKQDPDPHTSERLDPDPLKYRMSLYKIYNN